MSARLPRTPRAKVAGLYHATDAATLTLVFDAAPPDFNEGGIHDYRQNAALLVDALERHIPGALMDALLAELCARKASLLRVVVMGRRR